MNTGTAAGQDAPHATGVQAHRISLRTLLADAERLDDGPVTIDVLGLQVVEETPALADQHEQATAGMVILRVELEVLGQIGDALREERDLNFGRARVTGLACELLYNCALTFCCQGHFRSSFVELAGISQKSTV
jgi:hypothetical protein